MNTTIEIKNSTTTKAKEMLRWLFWFVLKCGVTALSAWTLFNVIHQQGYYIEFTPILVGSVLLVIMIKLWSWNYKKDDI